MRTRFCVSTLILTAVAGRCAAAAPQITAVEAPPGVPLQEGRTLPLRITGTDLTADLTPGVFDDTGQPATGFLASQYLTQGTNGTTAGVLLQIQVLRDLFFGQTRNLELRLAAPAGTSAVWPLVVSGLDELKVVADEQIELSDPTNATARVYSEFVVEERGVIRVIGDKLDVQVTGPVSISGTIDANGETGRHANDRLGGLAGRSGGAGGKGGLESPDTPPTHGTDGDLVVPGRKYSARSVIPPRGAGGLAGNDNGVETRSACSDFSDPECQDEIASLLQYDRFNHDLGEEPDYGFSRPMLAGAQGWSAPPPASDEHRPRPGHGGGGGGGGGEDAFYGGGGGAGGDGGRGVRIVGGQTFSLTGTVDTQGGPGGSGAQADTPAFLPEAPNLGELAYSGGGGGGGGGGEIIVMGRQGFVASPGFASRKGGAPGQGGMLLFVAGPLASVPPTSMLAPPLYPYPFVERSFERVAPGPKGSLLSGAGPFSSGALTHGVTTSAVMSVTDPEPLGSAPASFEIHGELLNQVRTVTVAGRPDPARVAPGPPFRANLVLFPGFNTIILRPTDGDEPMNTPAYELVFPRILCLSGPDTDGDGIPDKDEGRLGLNPNNSDSDGDGIPDGDDLATNPAPNVSDGFVRYVAGDGVCCRTVLAEENVLALETGLTLGSGFYGFATGGDGSMYISTPANNGSGGNLIRRVGPDGIINTIGGGGTQDADGIDARDWRYDSENTHGPSAGPDRSVYVFDLTPADPNNPVLRRIAPDGTVRTIAGGGNNDRLAAGAVPATSVHIPYSTARERIAVGPDGGVYFPRQVIKETPRPAPNPPLQEYMHVISRLDLGTGELTTFAGGGSQGQAGDIGDGGPALSAYLNGTSYIAWSSGGVLFAYDQGHIRKIYYDPSSQIWKIDALTGGSDKPVAIADARRALDYWSGFVNGMGAASDGTLYYTTSLQLVDPNGMPVNKGGIMRITPEGIRQVVLGFDQIQSSTPTNGQPARFTPALPLEMLAVGPDDRPLFVVNDRVGKVLYPGDPLPPDPKPAEISFEAAAANVSETAGQFSFKVRRLGSAGLTTCDLVLSGGTASRGGPGGPADFSGSTFNIPLTTIQFSADDRETTFTLNIIDDSIPEGVETIEFELRNAAMDGISIPTDPALMAATRIGKPDKLVITVLDDESPPPFFAGFPAGEVSVSENAGTVQLTVQRTGSGSGSFAISYTITGGTVTAGQDFNLPTGTLTFADGETQKTIGLAVLDDLVDEPDETLRITLQNPTANAAPGPISEVVVTIVDDDAAAPPPGTLQLSFTDASMVVTESTPSALITVRRTGVVNFPVSVDYAVSGGDATDGVDFTAVSGTLNFAISETEKTIRLPLRNDGLPEPDKTVVLDLTNPGGGASLGSPAEIEVTIQDDDGPPAPAPGGSAVSVVSLSGDQGIPNAPFSRFYNAAINNSGDVVLVGWAQPPGNVPPVRGVWLRRANSLELLVSEGSLAPGLVNRRFGYEFYSPNINDAGHVAFAADVGSLLSPGIPSGIWVWNSGVVTKRVAADDPAGGVVPVPGVVFRAVRPFFLFNGSDATAFEAVAGLPGGAPGNGFWLDSTALVLNDQPGPGLPGTSLYATYHDVLSTAGEVVLTGLLREGVGGVTADNSYVVWRGDGSGVSVLARDSDALPGTGGGTLHGVGIGGISVNRPGSVLLTSVDGLFLATPGGPSEVVPRNAGAPGTVGASFSGFSKPLLNDHDQVVFVGTLNAGSGDVVAGQNDSGVWSGPLSTLDLIARSGSPAPGTGAGVTFKSFLALALNNNEHVVLVAECSNDERGLWALGPCGQLTKVAFPGDQLEVSPGQFRQIARLNLLDTQDPEGRYPSSNGADGRPRFLNESGEVVFVAEFTDGSAGVFRQNLLAINCAEFALRNAMIREDAAVAIDLHIIRPGALGDLLALDMTVTAGNAQEGIDFLLPTNRVVFEPGQFEQVLPITPINNATAADDKVLELTLTDPATGNRSSVLVTIIDDDIPPAPPALSPQVQIESGRLRLRANARPGRRYAVEASTDLRTWIRTQSTVAAGSMLEFTEPLSPNRTRRFYRFRELIEGGATP